MESFVETEESEKPYIEEEAIEEEAIEEEAIEEEAIEEEAIEEEAIEGELIEGEPQVEIPAMEESVTKSIRNTPNYVSQGPWRHIAQKLVRSLQGADFPEIWARSRSDLPDVARSTLILPTVCSPSLIAPAAAVNWTALFK
ncbi:uncharacterized protein UHOD_11650 [Ustilago sp. UG-2017b]|nr:uncharacterized protein UHOD_11650 [Ustilago sp. UG-2017b]